MTSESDQNGQSSNQDPEYRSGSAIAMWMPIGVGLGVALGLVFDNIALGIAIGAALGGAFGAVMEQKRKGTEVENHANQRQRLLLVAVLGVLLLLFVVAILAYLRGA
jgi:hypothetical protein